MAPNKHDPFKNPAIAEALCEIHFGTADTRFWQSDWIAALKARVEKKFPLFEKKEIRELRAEFGPEGLMVADNTQAIPRAVFKTQNQALLMQVSPGLVAVNEVATYRGWKHLVSDLEEAWNIMEDLGKPQAVVRVGLRYINRIPRSDSQDHVGLWLNESPFIPGRLLGAKSRFMNRMEDSTNPAQRLIVTVAESIEGDSKPIVFDIDAISETQIPSNWSSIYDVVDRLHDNIWEVFSNAIGPKLKVVLDGGA